MRAACRVALIAAVSLAATALHADGIEPGLWKIINRTVTGGVIGPPHVSSKCLTAADTKDLAVTFSPVPKTINSVCAPIDRELNGPHLNWHIVCKGQLNMELSGEFNFDSAHHYSGTVRTKADMAGTPMVDTQNDIEGQWLSACPQ